MVNDGLNKVENKITSFLMAGQSNMAGRGNLGEVKAINNSLCYMLRMGRWQKMSEPINPDRSIFNSEFTSGTTLAASFADEYAKYTSSRVGLIPCADGGTKVSQWMPGEILFDHAVMMTKLAMRTSYFGGILWHQGESDCVTFNPQEYKKNLITVLTELRKQIGCESVPIIIGEISENISERWKFGENPPILNQILVDVASKVPYCGLAKADNLTLKEDGIHFNSVSSREYGKRYFSIYKQLAKI